MFKKCVIGILEKESSAGNGGLILLLKKNFCSARNLFLEKRMFGESLDFVGLEEKSLTNVMTQVPYADAC